MELWQTIREAYPELTDADFIKNIILQDDADGQGAYIAAWNYSEPIPEGLKLGK
jgi:hypothetical protein